MKDSAENKGKGPVLIGLIPAAAEIGADPKTVRKACEDGTIPGIRLGRCWRIPRWWLERQRDGKGAA